jgi:uncharacterized protein
MNLPHPAKLLAIVLISAISGAMNAIAGGGTLLTFPALVGLGISPIVANATSTVALWPASVTSIVGYRAELRGARRWAIGFAAPSLLGGAVGAWLLLRTPPSRFAALVPWLVLGATALFAIQPVVMRRIQLGRTMRAPSAEPRDDRALTSSLPSAGILLGQFAVAIYGGYFGAGVGILMLAVLGFMGLTNIHRMNGLKNWGGLCMNLVAAVTFAFSGLVSWPIALSMAVGSMTGGYFGSLGAQRTPRTYVRAIVVLIGLCGGVWLLVHQRA